MAIPTEYVYAPYTGYNSGQACHCGSCPSGVGSCNQTPPCNPAGCGGCDHVIPTCGGGWNYPIDVAGSVEGTPVKFYGSSGILSIRTRRIECMCLTDPNPWDQAVIVDLYLDTSGTLYVGSVLYGHLKTRIVDGLYSSGLWGLRIGRVVKLCNADTCPDCACSCYRGFHVHMQAKADSTKGFNCSQTLYKGSSWIYSFYTI